MQRFQAPTRVFNIPNVCTALYGASAACDMGVGFVGLPKPLLSAPVVAYYYGVISGSTRHGCYAVWTSLFFVFVASATAASAAAAAATAEKTTDKETPTTLTITCYMLA